MEAYLFYFLVLANILSETAADSNHPFLRHLADSDESPPPVQQGQPERDNSFMLGGMIFLGLLSLCCSYGLYQVMQFWCCRSRFTRDTVLVHDGVVFSLNSWQRRAVLEAIFSETTKVVSKKTLTSEGKNNDDDDDDDRFDVEKGIASDDMPGTPMNTTLESTEYEAGVVVVVDDEEGELSPPPSPKKAAPTECTSRQKTPVGCCVACAPETSPEAKQRDNNTKEEEEGVSRKATSGVDRSSVAWCASAAAAAPTDDDDDDASSSSSFVATTNPHLSLPTLKADGSSDYDDDDDVVFPLPSLKPAASRLMPENAVPNQIEEKPTPAPVMATMDDFDSDDDDENVCAICLNPYREGDVAVSSKYCQHLFHKDCILEWLEKNDDCPICRVEMVTAGDVDEAAKNIIGTPNNNNNTPPASPRPPRSGPTPHQSPLLRVVQALRSSSSVSSSDR